MRDGSSEMMHRLAGKVIESVDSGDYRCERGGNLRIGSVSPVGFSVDAVLMDRRAKGVANLPGGAGEFDHGASLGDAGDAESVGLQPVADRLNVLVGRTELLTKLLRREPLVKIG